MFAANAVSLGAGAALSVKFKTAASCLKVSCGGMLICSMLILGLLPQNISIFIFEAILFILCFALGLSFTISTAQAMDAERAHAGTASAIMGAGGFLFGSIVSPLVGLGNILIATGVIMLICALAASLCAYKAVKQS